MPDKMLKEPRNVTIDLRQNVGQYVTIELVFSNIWISISEITFSSSIARGSFEKEVTPKRTKETSTRKNVWKEIKHSTWDEKLSDYPRLNTKRPEGNNTYIKIHTQYNIINDHRGNTNSTLNFMFYHSDSQCRWSLR